MFDRGLTRLIRIATQRTVNGEAWPWGAILAAAYFMRRSLRAEEPVRTVRVRSGEEITIAVREPDD